MDIKTTLIYSLIKIKYRTEFGSFPPFSLKLSYNKNEIHCSFTVLPEEQDN